MKDYFKLIGITVLFVLTGLVLSYFALQDSLDYCVIDDVKYKVGDEIKDHQEGYSCVCSDEGLVECVLIELENVQEVDEDFVFDTADLEKEGLEYNYTYLTGFANGDPANVTSVKFTNISVSEDDLTVVLEQMQLCPEPNIAPEQVGFYEKADEKLSLYNMVKPSVGEDVLNCTVQLKYFFEDFGDLGNMKIAFVDSDGFPNEALMCVYNGNVYSDNDVFRNANGEVCTCLRGRISCERLSD